jgi:hypothetical protein
VFGVLAEKKLESLEALGDALGIVEPVDREDDLAAA